MAKGENYNTQEIDFDPEEAVKLCKGKTAEELDKEFEEFKARFIKKHADEQEGKPNDKV